MAVQRHRLCLPSLLTSSSSVFLCRLLPPLVLPMATTRLGSDGGRKPTRVAHRDPKPDWSTHLRSGKSGPRSPAVAKYLRLQVWSRELRQRRTLVAGPYIDILVLEASFAWLSGKDNDSGRLLAADQRPQPCSQNDASSSLVPNRDIGIQVQGLSGPSARCPTPQACSNGFQTCTSSTPYRDSPPLSLIS